MVGGQVGEEARMEDRPNVSGDAGKSAEALLYEELPLVRESK